MVSRNPLSRRLVFRVALLLVTALVILATTRVTILRPSHSYLAPDFTLLDLNANSVRLSAFRGKAVVLNFWAAWCPPCRREIPWFIELQKEYGPEGLQIIGVSMDEGGRNAIEPVVRRMGINYPVLLGNDQVGSLYAVEEILPTTYYLSRDGKVLAFVHGVISKTEIEHNVREALGPSSTLGSEPKIKP